MNAPVSDVFEIGLGKHSITPAPCGEKLMGWGDAKQTADSVALALYARASVLKTEGSVLAIVCLEICFITQAVRNEVLQRLQKVDPLSGWTEENILLCATHTHCSPGGHTHDVLYNLTSYGWYPHVFERYVEGSVAAVLEAKSKLQKGRIRFAEGEFDLTKKVAFNRSVEAWNQNPDVVQRTFADRDQALDRRMRLFRFENLEGQFIGCLNEFAVHCTSVHRDYNVIHSDNKGVAADNLENETGGICLFIQGAAGDVSPNFQRFQGLREVRGTDRDDLESARKNGGLQSDLAKSLIELAKNSTSVTAELDSTIEYVDFSDIDVDPQDVGGREQCRTGPAVIGARALLGTDEGMPTPKFLYYAATIFSRGADVLEFFTSGFKTKFLWNQDPVQGPKVGCLQSGEGQIFRARGFENSIVPAFLSAEVQQLKIWSQKKLMGRPLTPQILPIQTIRLGEWIWAAVPSEFTTTSGARLKASLLEDLKGTWATRALLIGYANSYSGYVTTPEEYQVQRYEGASTHFGQWTQPAYQTVFRALVKKLLRPKEQRSNQHVLPPCPTEAELVQLRAAPLAVPRPRVPPLIKI